MSLFFGPDGGGGGGGGATGAPWKNYFIQGNGNAENNNTTGWTIQNVGITSTFYPLYLSGASWKAAAVGLSLGVNGASVLAGAYSYQLYSNAISTVGDAMMSTPITIDQADQAKVMAFKFYYNPVIGGASLNFSGTSANTWAVWIYDVTNTGWIQPQGLFNMVQGTGTGYATGTFQTPSNMTSFQFALLNIQASGGSYMLLTDDFYLGPQTAPLAPVMSDWVSYTPTFGAGFGTVSNIECFWKRVGDSCCVQFRFQAGTVAASAANISLPSGLTISTLTNVTESGKWANDRTTSSVVKSGTLLAATGNTSIGFGIDDYTSTSNAFSTQNGNIVGTNNSYFTGFFKVPIVGWSSNAVSSADTDTRVVSTRATFTGAQNTTVAGRYITWDNVIKDTHGGWTATDTYTIPVSGDYRIGAKVRVNSTLVGENNVLQISRSGSSMATKEFVPYTTLNMFGEIDELIVGCKAGDTIKIYTQNSGGTRALETTAGYNSVWIDRISGPAVVQATESVNGRYYGASASVTGSYSAVTWSNKDYDSHSAYSGTTVTIPVSGKYDFIGQVFVSATTIAAGNTWDVALYKNGSNTNLPVNQYVYQGTNITSVSVPFGFAGINCNAGDTIVIQVQSNTTTPVFTASNTANFLSWKRVGN